MSIADKLTRIAENEQKVYDAGYEKGKAEGGDTTAAYEQGVADGKQAGYDAFWDAYQDNGNRTNYQNMFSGLGWTEKSFKPKYDIITTNNYMVFRACGLADLGAAIRNSGKRVVFEAGVLQYTFQYSLELEIIEEIEFKTPLTYITGAFANCQKLKKIQTLPIAENANTLDFTEIPLLEDISFSGVIPTNLSFNKSKKLSKASIENVINALSPNTSGLSVTFSKTAVNAAFETSVGAKDGSASTEWATLIATKQNWTINLV